MAPVLLLYVSFQTQRLQYTLQWILGEQLQLGFRITNDAEAWKQHSGPKINYSREKLATDELRIIPHPLLQENAITAQELSVNRWKHSTILFYNQPGSQIPFDIFSATFYLISRYEEYLPHRSDRHGRYDATQSVAAQYSFLQQPVVDEWLHHFRMILQRQYPHPLPQKKGTFLPTYDIDIAWRYLHKGSRRTWGGFLKDIAKLNFGDVTERKAVLSGKRKDPYDSFAWLDNLHRQYGRQPLYFLLLGQWSAFDKNALPESPAMQSLIQQLSAQYTTGIHPSYGTHSETSRLQTEIDILAKATGRPVKLSRQHYIKFTLPETYTRLIAAGISDDYSMGYASANGFRAGTSNAFTWYDLQQEQSTTLRIHPFAFMEATSKFYLRQSPEEAWLEWERLWHAVQQVQGTFIQVWHNHLLGEHRENKGWRELYLKILQYSA